MAGDGKPAEPQPLVTVFGLLEGKLPGDVIKRFKIEGFRAFGISKDTTLIPASLEESVGEFWFGEGAEVVIEGDFVGFLGAKTV